MLKLSEVAQRLKCSSSNVYGLVETGKLSVVCTGVGGKGYRVTEAELQRFIESGRKGKQLPPWPAKTNPRKPSSRQWF